MKLIMQQKVFSWTDRFRVWDEAGEDRYVVEGEFLVFGKRLHIQDPAGQEVALIERKLEALLREVFRV